MKKFWETYIFKSHEKTRDKQGYIVQCHFYIFLSDIRTCPQNATERHLLPHPDDCRKFIQCDNGFPIPKNCSADLAFDPNHHTCNYIGEFTCVKGGKYYPKVESLIKLYFQVTWIHFTLATNHRLVASHAVLYLIKLCTIVTI